MSHLAFLFYTSNYKNEYVLFHVDSKQVYLPLNITVNLYFIMSCRYVPVASIRENMQELFKSECKNENSLHLLQ